MADYRPRIENPIPLSLLLPTYTSSNGVKKKTFPNVENGIRFNGSFKTYGGTERDVNGVYSVEDTANIITWFMPEIESNCRIGVLQTGAIYEIVGEPENINMRNQFLKFKVKRVKGKA